jgi:hypothetical protein
MNLFKPASCEFNFRKIANTDVLVSEVFIDRDEYEVCEDFSHKMWANKKKGFYGRGMINNDDDPRRVERTGILGEMSVAKLLNLPINVTYMEGGDQQDFVIHGKRTDVKTATRNYGALLIRATYNNSLSDLINLDKDLYVAAYVIEDNRFEKFAKLGVVGYIQKDNLHNEYLKPARYRNASHNNWDIPYSDLIPINNLKA